MSNLAFGIRPPQDVTGPIWRAKANYTRNNAFWRSIFTTAGTVRRAFKHPAFDINVIWNQQEFSGGTSEERQAMRDWINTKGLPMLRQACTEVYLSPDGNDSNQIKADGYVLIASPKSSHLFLHLGCWRSNS